jgi:hypothetical protein
MRAALIAAVLLMAGVASGQVQFVTNAYTASSMSFDSLPAIGTNYWSYSFWGYADRTDNLLILRIAPDRETVPGAVTFAWPMLSVYTNRIVAQSTAVGSWSFTNVAQLGTWNHYAIVRDGTDNYVRGFVNGIELSGYGSGAGYNFDGRSFDNRFPFVIDTFKYLGGARAHFGGRYADVRIYFRALTPSEIRSIYETPYALADDPALVLRTCVASGDTGASLTGVARNYGTGPDGTYANGPTVAPFKIPFEPPMMEETP